MTYNTEQFIQRANKIHDNKYIYPDQYINCNTKIKIICPIHGEFTQQPKDHIHGKNGCQLCARKLVGFNQRKSQNDFIETANTIHGNRYNYNNVVYTNAHTKVTITCRIHGDFRQSPGQHCNHNQGCPKCKSSHGERKIRNFLKDNNITFIEQHKFKDCVNKKPLPFDFYIPDKNILIEYQGIQHYKTSSWANQEKLLELQYRDKIKYDYCQEKNINLILIPYYMNVNDVLSTKFLP